MISGRVVTLHFDPDEFLALVNDELDELGLLCDRLKGVATRRWHADAWAHRSVLPPSHRPSEALSWMSAEEFSSVLSTVDRVFVSAEPIREVMNYLRWLAHYATDFVSRYGEASGFLFSRVPHYPWEVMLALRANSMGRHVMWLEPTLISDRVVLATGGDFMAPRYLTANGGRQSDGNGIRQSELVSLRMHFSQNANSDESLVKRLAWRTGVFLWAFFPQSQLQFIRVAALNRKNQVIFSRQRLLAAYVRLSTQHWRMRRAIRSQACDTSEFVPYLLVALHFQPEASTDPLGGPFSNQVAFVNALRHVLDAAGLSDIPIVVREHPRQVAARVIGLGESHFRSLSDYKALANIHDVHFASMKASVDQLLDGALGAASVNGSILWQAMLKGKPAISGRKTWFSDCEGTAMIWDFDETTAISSHLSKSSSAVQESLARFLREETLTFRGATSLRYVTSEDKAKLAVEMALAIQGRLESCL